MERDCCQCEEYYHECYNCGRWIDCDDIAEERTIRGSAYCIHCWEDPEVMAYCGWCAKKCDIDWDDMCHISAEEATGERVSKGLYCDYCYNTAKEFALQHGIDALDQYNLYCD